MLISKIADQVEVHLLEVRHIPEYHQLVLNNLERLYWISGTPTLADSEKRVKAGLARLGEGSGFDTGIFDHGKLVGFAGLFYIHPNLLSGEMGYWVDKNAEGRGYVTRACHAVVSYGINEWGLRRIELRCAVGNQRSIAVAERLGFQLEGRLRDGDRIGDRWEDLFLYSMLADDWKALNA